MSTQRPTPINVQTSSAPFFLHRCKLCRIFEILHSKTPTVHLTPRHGDALEVK
jgi:hypothetical protein